VCNNSDGACVVILGDVVSEQAFVALNHSLTAPLSLVVDDVLRGAFAPLLPVEYAVSNALLLYVGDNYIEIMVCHLSSFF
jgi:hypothetical protein